MPNDFYEKTVENIIFDNRFIVHNHGLPKFRKTTFKQFILPSGKKIDILSYDLTDGRIVIDVYELKLKDINTDAICQAYNYFIELTAITGSSFRSIDIHIIMIGRNYIPVMLFEKMNLPFSVYTYDYKFTGIQFQKHIERKQHRQDNQNFNMGLWAFGSGDLSYPNGQPDSINLASVYQTHKNKEPKFHDYLLSITGNLFKEAIIKKVEVPVYLPTRTVKTEIFPLQPAWTKEFAASIPDDEYMLDLQDDHSDYEPEEIEADLSDYEPDPIEVEHEDEWFEVPEDEVILQPRIPMEDEFPMVQVNKYLKQITA